MATQRFGHLDDFTLKNTNVGIGTSTPQDKMEVIGGTRSGDLRVAGIATLTSAGGFIEKHIEYVENQVKIDTGDSGTLSGEIVVGSGLTMTVGTAATTSQGTVDALKVYDMFQPPSGGTNQRPPAKTGAIFYNFDFKTIEFFDGNSWRQVDNTTRSGRGVFGGGYDGSSRTSQTRHVNIMSLGNAIRGGDLLSAVTRVEACGNAVRSVWGGGYTPSHIDIIQYRAAASDGDTVDFGDLVTSRSSHFSASSSTRGTWGGGYSPGHINSINYVEIMTTGDALDFGDIAVSGPGQINATQSPTRAVLGGGTPGNGDGIMTTFNFSSKGNSVFFGNLTQARRDYGGGGNNTRGVFCGGSDANSSSIIDFITIASDGNATFFGDLTQEKRSTNCCDSQTRTIIVGSSTPSGRTNVLDYITIATTGNALDFGDDIRTDNNIGTTSDSHGGLGGF
jgi:hypothetical protein